LKRLVLVPARIRDRFRAEWRDIDRRFPHFSPAPDGMRLDEHWEHLAMLRHAARDELRLAIVEAANIYADEGDAALYAIAV